MVAQRNSFYSVPSHADLRTRFEASYIPEPNSGCWLWVASLQSSGDKDGRGAICVDGKSRFAHRVSYELHKGPIPASRYICHRCNNTLCVNPDHLYAGTQKDNVRDMIAAGHHVGQIKSRDRISYLIKSLSLIASQSSEPRIRVMAETAINQAQGVSSTPSPN